MVDLLYHCTAMLSQLLQLYIEISTKQMYIRIKLKHTSPVSQLDYVIRYSERDIVAELKWIGGDNQFLSSCSLHFAFDSWADYKQPFLSFIASV